MARRTDSPNQLAADRVVRMYSVDECDKLLTDLELLYRRTLMVPIRTHEDLLLDPDGCMSCCGYPLTAAALTQLCSALSWPLFSLVNDIGNRTRGGYMTPNTKSVPVAVKILNQCIKLRFCDECRLVESWILQNTQDRRVDGFTRSDVAPVPSYEVYSLAVETAKAHGLEPIFGGAMMHDRQLMVDYLLPKSFTLDDGTLGRLGFFFVYSENEMPHASAGWSLHVGGATEKPRRMIFNWRTAKRAFSKKYFMRRLTALFSRQLDFDTVRDELDRSRRVMVDTQDTKFRLFVEQIARTWPRGTLRQTLNEVRNYGREGTELSRRDRVPLFDVLIRMMSRSDGQSAVHRNIFEAAAGRLLLSGYEGDYDGAAGN